MTQAPSTPLVHPGDSHAPASCTPNSQELQNGDAQPAAPHLDDMDTDREINVDDYDDREYFLSSEPGNSRQHRRKSFPVKIVEHAKGATQELVQMITVQWRHQVVNSRSSRSPTSKWKHLFFCLNTD